MLWPFSRKSSAVLSQETDPRSPSPGVRFAFRLFRELARADESSNVFFSPSSVMLCLTLVQELASGETRRTMLEALELAGITSPERENEIGVLKSAFRPRAGAAVAFANSLWLGSHAHIAEELAARLRQLYESELATLDFSGHDAVPIINAWVNTKTRGKISKIVNQLSPLTALVAVNAVYFKGVWASPFRREWTRDGPFTTASGRPKQLPMMLQSGTYQYYEDKQLQMAALPYTGGMSMYVVLPAAETDARQFSRAVGSASWESWLARSRRMEGTIQLPRFKADYDAELKPALKLLGMERAFDQSRAEFDPIRTDRPPVWIDQVIHRAVADVNEEGTEAAAVTAVHVLGASAMNQKPQRHFSMILNRPFLMVIRDQATKAILFMGWIADPQ
jgi:serine protease inhibitor